MLWSLVSVGSYIKIKGNKSDKKKPNGTSKLILQPDLGTLYSTLLSFTTYLAPLFQTHHAPERQCATGTSARSAQSQISSGPVFLDKREWPAPCCVIGPL